MTSSTNSPVSVYNRVLAMYAYEGSKLNFTSGKQSSEFSGFWETFQRLKSESLSNINSFDIIEYLIDIKQDFAGQSSIKAFEFKLDNENQTRGLICSTIEHEETDFDLWFISHILNHSTMGLAEQKNKSLDTQSSHYTDLITKIFDEDLRNITGDDKWEQEGKSYFKKVVTFFTSRMIQIETCLPAFPCKSHNTQKVAGTLPDKGEELALRRLASVANKIQQVYPPGIKMWVVSDGHVFSDCSTYPVCLFVCFSIMKQFY